MILIKMSTEIQNVKNVNKNKQKTPNSQPINQPEDILYNVC